MRWLAPYLEELTAEQLVAVRRIVLGVPGDPGALGRGVAVTSTASTEQSLNQLLDVVRLNLLEWYPGLKVPEAALVVSDEPGDTTFSAVAARPTPTGYDFAPTGPLDTCVVTAYGTAVDLLERVQAGAEPRWRLEVPIAHELIHCAQFAAASDVASQSEWPRWLIEGSAAWGMRVYAYRSSGTPLGQPLIARDALWDKYLDRPNPKAPRSLFERSYDALGFYAHMQLSGQDPWSTMLKMVDAAAAASTGNRDAPAFEVAVAGGPDDFLATWATGTARRPQIGPNWDTDGPGISDYVPPLAEFKAAEGSPQLQIPIAVVHKGQILVDQEAGTALLLGVRGYGGLAWYGAGEPVQELVAPPSAITNVRYDRAYCNDTGGCRCPEGQTLASPFGPLAPIPVDDLSAITFAVTGGSGTASVYAEIVEYENWCRRIPTEVRDCEHLGPTLAAVIPGELRLLTATVVDGTKVCAWTDDVIGDLMTVVVGSRAPHVVLERAEDFKTHFTEKLGYTCDAASGTLLCVRQRDDDISLEAWFAPDVATGTVINGGSFTQSQRYDAALTLVLAMLE